MEQQKNPRNNTLIGLFIVVGGIVMLGLVGYVLYSVVQDSVEEVSNTNSGSVVKNSNTNTDTNTNFDNSAVDTSDRRMYENEEYGYSLQYDSNKVQIDLNDVFERGTEGNPSFRINSGGHFAVGVWENLNSLTAKEWLESNNDTGSAYSYSDISIGAVQATRAINISYKTCHIEWNIIQKAKSVFTLAAEICKEEVEDSLSEFRNIVSSFQFTETTDTSDWITYENDEFNFSIQQPSRFITGESEITYGNNTGTTIRFSRSTGQYMTIDIFSKDTNESAEQAYERITGFNLEEYETSAVMVGGTEVSKYLSIPGYESTDVVLFSSGEYFFSLIDDGLSEFDEVVSTFSF